MPRILVIDDEENMRWALKKALTKDGYQVITASDAGQGLELIKKHQPDLVLSDVKMPGMDGMELLNTIRAENPELPVIMVTGFGSIELAVEAMKAGAADFILKPFDIETVKLSVQRALGIEKLKEEVRFWRNETGNTCGIIGQSRAILTTLDMVKQVAPSPATVLITGESGTGKELVAHAIHQLSARAGQPLIKVNCAALPENLLESELFGHEKGAFTGAINRKLGRFERADDGSIFLDEIGELSPGMQAKLLRVLQEKEIERVGGVDTIKVDVRVIAATNRDLEQEVDAGSFREDLYYRLKVVPIWVPPLRERKDDIPELAANFAEQYARELGKGSIKISSETMDFLNRYNWPGNVRELQNVIERAVILCREQTIVPDLLPVEVLTAGEMKSAKNGSAVGNTDFR
ncbi:MAG: sigma-54-dependent transcriptional regulator, partial [Methylocystaceae bacterium]